MIQYAFLMYQKRGAFVQTLLKPIVKRSPSTQLSGLHEALKEREGSLRRASESLIEDSTPISEPVTSIPTTKNIVPPLVSVKEKDIDLSTSGEMHPTSPIIHSGVPSSPATEIPRRPSIVVTTPSVTRPPPTSPPGITKWINIH